MKHRTHNRILSFFLALVMLCTSAPFPVNSVEIGGQNGSATDTNYGKYICCSAKFNLDYNATFLVYTHPAEFDYNGSDGEFDYDISDGDGSDWDNDAYWLSDEDIPEKHLFVITNYYYDEQTMALWYKVEAAPGYELPGKMAENGYVWVFQNFTDVYADEGWEEYAPDALIIDEDDVISRVEPASVVSSNGVMVVTNRADLKELSVVELDTAPTASYISQAVAYEITPKTAHGNYTGFAKVSLRIPEGWDTSKLFGYVREADGSITVLAGSVVKSGLFTFYTPHFSEMGMFEATAVAAVPDVTLVLGQVSGEYEVSSDTTEGTAGRFVTDDGAVDYLVRHVDGGTKITFQALDVTSGTQITVGGTTYIVMVEAAEKTVSKILYVGEKAKSTTLDPLYDLGIGGDYTVLFEKTEDTLNVVELDASGKVTVNGSDAGSATIKATVKHAKSGNIVGTVTYTVTVSSVEVTDVKNIYVPLDASVTIDNLNGTINTTMLEDTIATVSPASGTLTSGSIEITGKIENETTAVVVGSTLFNIYVTPKNTGSGAGTQRYTYLSIGTMTNCTAYYAINGGELYPIEGSGILIQETYTDGFNIMLFSVPNDNCATVTMSVGEGTFNQFYSLCDGIRYDGSDSFAWPFLDPNQSEIPTTSGGTVNDSTNPWKDGNYGSTKHHGMKWCLKEGNLTIDEMRDLFARALSLGADSVTTFTKNSSDGLNIQNISFTAQALPTLNKQIVKIVRDGNEIPLDSMLEFGDVITYKFTIESTSDLIDYSKITIVDSKIGQSITVLSGDSTCDTFTDTYEMDYVVNETDFALGKYGSGTFENEAVLTYTYNSQSGLSTGTSTSSSSVAVSCKISGIVSYVWDVDTPAGIQGDSVTYKLPADAYVRYSTTATPATFTVDNTAYPNYAVLDDAGNVKGYYVFDGWYYDADGDGAEETGATGATLTMEVGESYLFVGRWTYEVAKYTVTWVDADGTELEKDENVEYGAVPTYDGAEPTKPATAQYTYIFKGWTPSTSPVTGDVTYTAVYASVVNEYDVIWKNEDGTVLEKDENVAYGELPSYDGETPTKPATAQYTYTFAGWTPDVDEVTGDITYTATYTSTVNKYTIQFVNDDGVVLQESQLEYGAKPVYNGSTPIKAATAQYTYAFDGWDKEIVEVTGNATYKATYTETIRTYTVTWVNEGGEVLEVDENVPYGTDPKYNGETPTKAADVVNTYTFVGWSPATVPVTGDATYTATFDPHAITYTITWLNGDGSVLKTDELTYGAMPNYVGETPTKTGTAQYGYVFVGWSPEVSAVTGDATYTPQFEQIINTYTVTWVDDDGRELEVDANVQYGAMPSYDSAEPTKAADAQYTYTFAGWTPSISPVTGDVIYTATYTKTVNKYIITFVDEDGKVLQTSEVEYGQMPTPPANPTKPRDMDYTYSFKEWSPTVVNVTGNQTYTATYNAKQHVVYIGINYSYHMTEYMYQYPKDGIAAENAYHKFPQEPREIYVKALRAAYQSDGNWNLYEADDTGALSGLPSDYINEAVFEAHDVTTNSAYGVFDPTGEIVKQCFQFAPDDPTLNQQMYDALLTAWLKHPKIAQTDIYWNNVAPENCRVIPYVVKQQSTGNWYVDMVIVVEETSLTIEAPKVENSDGQVFLFAITATDHPDFAIIVAVPEGESVEVNGLFPGKEYIVTELTGWSWRCTETPTWAFTTDKKINYSGVAPDLDKSGGGDVAKFILGTTTNKVVFTNTWADPDWLGDEAHKDNDFGEYHP